MKRGSAHLDPPTGVQQKLDKHFKKSDSRDQPAKKVTTMAASPSTVSADMAELQKMLMFNAESNKNMFRDLCTKIDEKSQKSNEKMDEIVATNEKTNEKIDNLDTKLAAFDSRLCQAESSISNNAEEIRKLWAELSELKRTAIVPAHAVDIDRMEKCARDLDALERRNNLIITGLKEEQGETKAQLLQKVTALMNDISLIDAHPTLVSRKGNTFIPGKNRIVHLQFETKLKRDRVWNARLALRTSRLYSMVYIDSDLTREVQHQRYLERQARRAQNNPPTQGMQH